MNLLFDIIFPALLFVSLERFLSVIDDLYRTVASVQDVMLLQNMPELSHVFSVLEIGWVRETFYVLAEPVSCFCRKAFEWGETVWRVGKVG